MPSDSPWSLQLLPPLLGSQSGAQRGVNSKNWCSWLGQSDLVALSYLHTVYVVGPPIWGFNLVVVSRVVIACYRELLAPVRNFAKHAVLKH